MSAELISVLSLVVAGIALGWNIYRDCINKPKVKVNIYIAECFLPGRGPQPQVVSVNVTNVGKQAIIIKGHGFTAKDKKQFLFPDMMNLFNNKKLEPYEYLDVNMPNEILKTLIEKSDQISSFSVFDTTGKNWKPPRKVMKEFVTSLKAKKATE